jgi:hemerythrin-like domain-containing protein
MMGPTLITIGSDASVAEALQLARSNQVHHLPVLSGSELVGLMCTCDVRDAAPESLVAQRMSQENPPETQRSQLAPPSDQGFELSPSPIPDPRPLESLIREHRLIGKLAQALSNFSECFAFQPTPHDRNDLAKFARVFRELGDCMHHEKEETVLLPLLAHLGFDWEDGPVAEVRQEHCQERYLIDVLCQAVEREGDWSADERRRVCATASALAEFQRAHLHKENTVLFPVILQRLSANEQRLLESELHIFDLRIDRYMPRGELTALAEDLIRRYLPSLLADSAVVECGLSALVLG